MQPSSCTPVLSASTGRSCPHCRLHSPGLLPGKTAVPRTHPAEGTVLQDVNLVICALGAAIAHCRFGTAAVLGCCLQLVVHWGPAACASRAAGSS